MAETHIGAVQKRGRRGVGSYLSTRTPEKQEARSASGNATPDRRTAQARSNSSAATAVGASGAAGTSLDAGVNEADPTQNSCAGSANNIMG